MANLDARTADHKSRQVSFYESSSFKKVFFIVITKNGQLMVKKRKKYKMNQR